MTWWEELEQLREEQRPKKQDQPFLRVPMPEPPPPQARDKAEKDDEADRGVCYLDM